GTAEAGQHRLSVSLPGARPGCVRGRIVGASLPLRRADCGGLTQNLRPRLTILDQADSPAHSCEGSSPRKNQHQQKDDGYLVFIVPSEEIGIISTKFVHRQGRFSWRAHSTHALVRPFTPSSPCHSTTRSYSDFPTTSPGAAPATTFSICTTSTSVPAIWKLVSAPAISWNTAYRASR